MIILDAHIYLYHQIDNHHFGSAVLSTLAVQMATEGPLEEIQDVLNQVHQQLVNDQKESDAQNAQDEAKCSSDIAQYNSNIDFHSAQLKANQELKASHEVQLSVAEKNLNVVVSDLESTVGKISNGDAVREAQNKEYQQQIAEHDEALAAIDEAVTLVSHLKAGTAFVQLKSRFSKVNEKMSNSKVKHSLYQPIIQALSQLASKADQEAVKNILALLGRLRESLVASKEAEIKEEQTQANDWTNTRARLVEEERSLRESRAKLQAEIEAHKKVIGQASSNINNHSVNLETNKGLLADTQKRCDTLKNNYVSSSAERYF